MPARSNEFQKLVYLIRHNLANGNAEVTESKMLKDLVSGEEVEVDVCIEGLMAGQPIIVSIECRDRSRKADRNWIFEMKGKHERLPTHALVLASAKGFSKSAVEVARSFGIETVWLDEVEDSSFPVALRNAMSLWHRTITITAERVWFVVDATAAMPSERVRVSADQNVYDPSGAYQGTASNVVAAALNAPAVGRLLLEEDVPDAKWFSLSWDNTAAGAEMCLEKIEPRVLRRVVSIEIEGPCVITVSEFRLKRAKIGKVHFAYGTAHTFDRQFTFVATRDEVGTEKISAHVCAALSSAPPADRPPQFEGGAYGSGKRRAGWKGDRSGR
jgi:hypothetical protein